MNGVKYLLDTNIILGIIKGNPDAGIKLKGINLKTCAYSSITRMELLEDLKDLATVAELKNEPTISLDSVIKKLKANDLL